MKRRFCLLLTILLAAGSVPVQADETAFPDLSFDSYFGDTLETYCEENELSPENLTEILPYEYSLNTPVVYQGWEFDKYLAVDRTHELIYGGGYRLTVDAEDEKLETLVKDLAENLTLTFGEPYVNEYVDTGVLKITEMESIEEAREATRAQSTWEGTYQFANIPEYEGISLAVS